MHFRKKAFHIILLILVATAGHQASYAQKLLNSKVSIAVTRKPVSYVLDNISKQAGFYFSYISTTVNNDSIVTITANNKTVRQVLEMLFADKYQYRETDNHIIIQPAVKEKWYFITGKITDGYSGIALADASVVERQQLASTLTGADGRFKLPVRETDRYGQLEISVSLGTIYADTTFILPKGNSQEINIQLYPSNHTLQDFEVTQYAGVERSWLGRTLFSQKLRKQSANLGKFFVEKPFQVSLTPGLGSHGKLSGQVTNAFSFNMLGGYAAGVNGFELGGLFNIDKKDVKYVQIGGLFNVVSGGVEGVQIAGMVNRVNDSVSGLQISGIQTWVIGSVEGMTISGISGRVKGSYSGFQLSGINNKVDNIRKDSVAFHGFQLAGLVNKANGKVKGMQLAGLFNRAKDVEGAQISTIYNKARRVKGFQMAFINIADTVDGYSLGFINIVRKGYHSLSLSSNDVFNTNVSFLSGNTRLYGIYTFGINLNTDKKGWGLGYGIGSQLPLTKKVSVLAELTSTAFNTSDTLTPNILKFRTGFNFQLAKKFAIHMGPSVCMTLRNPEPREGYQTISPEKYTYEFYRSKNIVAWVGWQMGVNIF